MFSRRFSTAVMLLALMMAAAPALADTERAGKLDLLFGIGSLSSQTATIDGLASLEAGDGVAFDFRFRFHINPQFAIEVGGAWESENTDLVIRGYPPDSFDSDTSFYFVNGLFNMLQTPVSPYVSLGGGWYEHDAEGYVQEEGGLLNAAVGIDGRTSGHMIWAFEVKWLHYEFGGFDEDWDRYQFSGFVGFHF